VGQFENPVFLLSPTNKLVPPIPGFVSQILFQGVGFVSQFSLRRISIHPAQLFLSGFHGLIQLSKITIRPYLTPRSSRASSSCGMVRRKHTRNNLRLAVTDVAFIVRCEELMDEKEAKRRPHRCLTRPEAEDVLQPD